MMTFTARFPALACLTVLRRALGLSATVLTMALPLAAQADGEQQDGRRRQPGAGGHEAGH
mgnify:CR=1 FL=1